MRPTIHRASIADGCEPWEHGKWYAMNARDEVSYLYDSFEEVMQAIENRTIEFYYTYGEQ